MKDIIYLKWTYRINPKFKEEKKTKILTSQLLFGLINYASNNYIIDF